MQRSPAENLLTQRSAAGLTCHHSVPLRSSLGNAAPPCDVDLLTQHLPARIVVDAEPILRDTVANAEPILRDTVSNAEPILRDTVANAEPILRDTVANAEPILRDTVDNAEPILRSTFLHTRGSLAVRERKSYIAGLVAARAVVTETLKPDTMTHRSVRTEVLNFFWAGNPAPFTFFSATSLPRNQLRRW
jgi:hypothetical protein